MLESFINYTIIELGNPDNETSFPIPISSTNFTITPLMPGTTYVVEVSYSNQVGQSQDNPIGESGHRDMMIFRYYFCVFVYK